MHRKTNDIQMINVRACTSRREGQEKGRIEERKIKGRRMEGRKRGRDVGNIEGEKEGRNE